MFALQVTEELESWPEQALHDRKWVCYHVWQIVGLREHMIYIEQRTLVMVALFSFPEGKEL